jgi:hypothetical protein
MDSKLDIWGLGVWDQSDMADVTQADDMSLAARDDPPQNTLLQSSLRRNVNVR